MAVCTSSLRATLIPPLQASQLHSWQQPSAVCSAWRTERTRRISSRDVHVTTSYDAGAIRSASTPVSAPSTSAMHSQGVHAEDRMVLNSIVPVTALKSDGRLASNSSQAFDDVMRTLECHMATCLSCAANQASHEQLERLVTSVSQHPDAHASIARVIKVVSCFWKAAHLSKETATQEHHRPWVEDGLSMYLQKVPPQLLEVSACGLSSLLAALPDPSQVQAFYSCLWQELRGELQRSWTVPEAVAAGRSLLSAAEECHRSLQPQPDSLSSPASATSCLAPSSFPYTPTSSLWPLHHMVHTDIFNSASDKLMALLPPAELSAACGYPAPMDEFEEASEQLFESDSEDQPPPKPRPSIFTLAQATGFRYPNTAHNLLMSAAAFNDSCQDNCHMQDQYVCSRQWLNIVAAAALVPLSLIIVTRSELCSLMESLQKLRKGTSWRPTKRMLACLDDTLLVVAFPGASLAAMAQLLVLRVALGPLPEGSPLVQRVNEAALVQGAAGMVLHSWPAQQAAGAVSDPEASSAPESTDPWGSIDPAQQELAEMGALVGLLQMAASSMCQLPGFTPGLLGSLEEESAVENCGLDVDVLFNKAYLSLALSGEALWQSPDFLNRLYPNLVEAARHFDQHLENLQVDRYAAAVSQHLSLSHQPYPDSPLSEVGGLCNVLSAVQDVPHRLDEEWQALFQHHSARMLVVGVSNHFIRVQQWLQLMQRLVSMQLACPQLAAAVAWALVHESAPFRQHSDVVRAAQLLVQMLGGSLESQESPRLHSGGLTELGSSFGSSSRRSGASAAGLHHYLPGVGTLDERLLAGCMEAGRGMGLEMPSAEEWRACMVARLMG